MNSEKLKDKEYAKEFERLHARDALFAATDTTFAPWHVALTDDKRRGRLNIISHLLKRISYKYIKEQY